MANEDESLVNVTAGIESNDVTIHQFVRKQVNQNDVMTTSNKLPDDDFIKAQLGPRILPSPYDPFQLSILAESSSILGQCVTVMEVNIDSFGFDLRPSVDEQTFKEFQNNPERKAEIDAEYRRMKNFFKYCNRQLSYTQIRRRTRRDFELLGNGYWEMLRNQLTLKITGIEWVPAHTVRIGRVDKFFTNVMSKQKLSDTDIEVMPDKKRFRRYVQIKESQAKPIWFKEFGDPRLMDAETGGRATVERNEENQITKLVPQNDGLFVFDEGKFRRGEMVLATEVLHFCNFQAPRTMPYGSPRWIGNLINIVGGRSSEEVNYMYFDNKTVPPGMLLVSGGRLTNDAVDRVTNHIKENVKGAKNFHAILVVEAETSKHPQMPNQAIPQLQWVSMKDAHNTDALFQVYEQNAMEKVISSFRFWAGYVARTKDINVATAEVARQISEEQVFQPERDEFDSIINRTILVDMDINYWEHKTKGPQSTRPKELAEMLDKVKPFLTGKEGRQIAEVVFGREFEEIEGDWLDKPLVLVIAELAGAAATAAKMGDHAKTQLETMAGGKVKETGTVQPTAEELQTEGVKKLMDMDRDAEAVTTFVKRLVEVRKVMEAEAERLAGKAVGSAT